MSNRLTRWWQKRLGDRALSVRKYQSAIKHYDKLYLMAKRHFGTHNLVTAEAATKLSYALLRTQSASDLDLAESLMQETVETTSRLLPKGDFRHAEIDAVLGEIALRKHQYLNARELLQRAVDVFDITPEMNTFREVVVLELLEQTCHELGRTEQEQAVRRRINVIEDAQRQAASSFLHDELRRGREF